MKNVVVFIIFMLLPFINAEATTLNILIWEKYISPDLLNKWTSKTGVQIRQIFFDNGDDRDRLLSDPDGDVDIAIMNENVTRLFSRKNKLVEISTRTVPSISHSVPRWRERCSGYGLPYFWGTLGIVYRPDKVSTPPVSWEDILTPSKELSGHIAMLHAYDDLLTPPLILAHKSVSTENEADLKIAFATLKVQAPSVKTYDYIVTSSQQNKSNSDLFMALAYSGDQFVLSKTLSTPWQYVVPKEGTVIWVDCMTVATNSKRKDLALRFLDFINQPANAAENAIYLSLPPTNLAAINLLPAKMKNDPEIFPPEEILASSQFYQEYPAQVVQIRKRIANSISNLHDTQ